ncbi:restriction endonuclease [Prevotella loescheii]|nr:restriction endonuclease [Hoylesella loescheii]
MRIIIEEYKYAAADVKDVLKGIDALENVEGYVSVNYVGYFYNTDKDVRDCVFILPKVLLEDMDGRELVFGKYCPEEIVNLDAHNPLTQQEKDFIYEFAVWIYRAIVVFHNDKRNKTSIVYHKKIAEVGKGGKHLSNTFLDILLSLVQFNKDNQDFFFYVLRNIHAGFNKINWNRTIATTPAIIQDSNAVYLRPVNKKRQINFDEELLVIFFSILNYIHEHYGFPVNINCNFDLITGKQFKVYLNGMGKMRLKQIKYKYFSDKALELWDLCYAFFDSARQIYVSSEQKEYLLVKNFNIVFESIIDELVGDRNIPAGLKEQDDGKRIDHMYSYQGLTTYEEDKPIYYIGDSKYYKRGNHIGKESVYKQFTYARNVIQWNLNLFMNDDRDDEELQYDKNNFGNVPKLRDDVTEGYNVIPNFFISAKLNKELSYKDEVEITDKKNTHFSNNHFENRLFDRDTLLICHYDVNFLYVISLYARNNSLQKDAWKKKVRDTFRSEIQRMLTEQYSFYAMQAHPNVDATQYIEENFKEVLGKLYQPFPNKEFFSLALDSNEKYKEENDQLLDELKKHFYVEECRIGTDPTEILEGAKAITPVPVGIEKQKTGVLMVMMENFADKCVKFLPYGKIAIGIKYSKDSMAIVEHRSEIGYILFHTRKDVGQHLFAINSDITMVDKEELCNDVYKNVSTTEMYAVVPFETIELDSSHLHSSKKSFTPKTRCDAQFEELNNLQ